MKHPASQRPGAVLSPDSRETLSAACREFFDAGLVAHCLRRVRWPNRERVLTAEVMVGAMIHLVLSTGESLARLMTAMRNGEVVGARAPQFSSSAFYKRLRTIPHELFLEILRETTQQLRPQAPRLRKDLRKLVPFANQIIGVDDTTLDALVRKTPSLVAHPKGAWETLAGRLGCAMDLTTGLFVEVMYDSDARANEKNHFWPLIERLGAGNLVLFDLGYFSFPLFDRLTESFTYFICPLRKNTTIEVVRQGVTTPVYRESIVYLGLHRSDRAAYPVRLVEMKFEQTWYRYITNMADPRQLSAKAIWMLYKERWSLEKAFADIKRGLGAAYLHPCHVNGVLTQLWSTLAVYQMLQHLRLEVTEANRFEHDQVSWSRLVWFLGYYLERPNRGLSLRDYLCEPDTAKELIKLGTRKRVPDEPPPQLAAALRKRVVPWELPPPQKPRQGKPAPRSTESLVVVAKLTP